MDYESDRLMIAAHLINHGAQLVKIEKDLYLVVLSNGSFKEMVEISKEELQEIGIHHV